MGAAIFSGVLIGTKSLFCFRSISCLFEHYAAHRKPPLFALCCKKEQQQTPRAQQCTSSLVIPCAHGKLNVKHHRKTPRPEIHTSMTAEKDEAALARKLYRAPKRTQTAQQQQQCEYIHICTQARSIATNPRSMEEACEYGLQSGTYAVSRWSRSPSS